MLYIVGVPRTYRVGAMTLRQGASRLNLFPADLRTPAPTPKVNPVCVCPIGNGFSQPNIYQGRMEGYKECIKSCVVTRCFLPYHMTGGKVIIDNLSIAPLEYTKQNLIAGVRYDQKGISVVARCRVGTTHCQWGKAQVSLGGGRKQFSVSRRVLPWGP